METTKRIIPCCTTCGSSNVRADAYAEWDFEKQRWSLASTYDNTICEDCAEEPSNSGECDLEEVEVSPGQTPEAAAEAYAKTLKEEMT